MAPTNNIERRAAKQLVANEGINYTEALRRIRITGVKPSVILAGLTLTTKSAEMSSLDRTVNTLTKLGGFILKGDKFPMRDHLKELLDSGANPKLNGNITKVLSEGTATGQAKAANALIRFLATWDLEKKTAHDADMRDLAGVANGSILVSWSLGNLLEEIDTTIPLNGSEIDLDAEKDWTELSSRVEEVTARVGELQNTEGLSVKQLSRGMAAIGLASLHGVEKSDWFMVRSGWQATVSKKQKKQIKQHGNDFVLWAGAAENVEEIIRAAGEHRTLDPEVLKPLIEAARA